MKKTFLLFILLIIAITIKAQMPAQVVHDPVNNTVQTAIRGLQEVSTNIQNVMREIEKAKIAVDAYENFKTIKEIMTLIDNLSCLTTELQYNLMLSNRMNCLTALNYEALGINLSHSTEIIKKLFLTKNLFTMTSGERLKNLNDVVILLQSTIKDLGDFNSTVREYMRTKITNKYVRQTYTQAIGFRPSTGKF